MPITTIIIRLKCLVYFAGTILEPNSKFPIPGCDGTHCNLTQNHTRVPSLIISVIYGFTNNTSRVIAAQFHMHIDIQLEIGALKILI